MRLESTILCDKKVPSKFKDMFYKMVIRPTLLDVAKYTDQKFSHSENASGREEDVMIDMLVYQKR